MVLFGRTAARTRMHLFLQLQLRRQSMTWIRLLNYPLHIPRGREALELDATVTVVMVTVAAIRYRAVHAHVRHTVVLLSP